MTDSEITTTILRQIRDEIVTTRTELRTEIAAVRAELSATRTELRAEIAETRTELKAEIALVGHTVRDLAVQMLTLTRYVKNTNDDLKKRVTRLEKKSG